MIYKLCKASIIKGTYGTYEEMMNKLDVFYLGNRITKEQYEELVELLKKG